MKKIELPFKWNYDLPSIVLFQFQIDLAQLNDESNDMSEFPYFFLDLKTGEIDTKSVFDSLEDAKIVMSHHYDKNKVILADAMDKQILKKIKDTLKAKYKISLTYGFYENKVSTKAIKKYVSLYFQNIRNLFIFTIYKT